MKITKKNYEEYALEYLEKELSAEMTLAFEEFLSSHPEIREELAGLREVTLFPDMAVKYSRKASLYREHKKRQVFLLAGWSRFGAAAAVLLLLSAAIFLWWNSNTETGQTEGAWVTELPENKPSAESEIISIPSVRAEKDRKTPETEKNTPDSEWIVTENIRETPAETGSDEQPEDPETDPFLPSRPIELTRKGEQQVEWISAGEKYDHEESYARDLVSQVQPLPGQTYRIESPSAPKQYKTISRSVSSADQKVYKIRIPEELLSETWTDLSLNNVKNKLIPEIFNR